MATLTYISPGLLRKCRLETNHGVTLGDYVLGLYINNHVPAPSDTGPEYTECTLVGYAEVDLVGANWSTPTLSGGIGSTVYPNVTFTFTVGGQTIFGVLLFDQGTNINAAGLLDTPFTVPGGGGTLTITNLTVQNKNC